MIDNYTIGMCVCPGTEALQHETYVNGTITGAIVTIVIVLVVAWYRAAFVRN